MWKLLVIAWVVAARAADARPMPATVDDATMTRLARDVLATYREADRATYLNNVVQLDMLAGRPADAAHALAELPHPDVRLTIAVATARGQSLASAFHAAFDKLDDLAAQQALGPVSLDPSFADQDLADAIAAARAQASLDDAAAIALARAYLTDRLAKRWAPLLGPLIAADDARRYAIDDVLVPTSDGAQIETLVYRPRALAKATALLFFTIYSRSDWSYSEARRSAAHGYAGVVGYTRGKGKSTSERVPYEHDGDDATAVIDWLAKQPWCDGRVGMYGGSYVGFVQWATAKHHPAALKAIMPQMTAAPGLDVPMEHGVWASFIYPWPFYTLDNAGTDDAVYNDRARWDRMQRTWYSTGQAYRALPQIDGHPNPWFERWLSHPSYDAYWQAMIPQQRELASIDIPVLTTTGYYDGAQVGALHYYLDQLAYDAHADHTLLIGPYEHLSGQRRVLDVLGGYAIDPVAQIDLRTVRYEWFDYIFKHGPRPALLADRVNYEVMGANVWKHAPSIAAMASARPRFYLVRDKLATAPAASSVKLRVDFADRSDVDYEASSQIITKQLDTHAGLAFATDPLAKPTELAGLFSGELDFVTNKRDFDLSIQLYEQTASGEYFALSSYLTRASYAADPSQRRLLEPGKHQHLHVDSHRLTAKVIAAGSRIIAVIAVPKQRDIEINYGTGKDVADETIADAKIPLEINWYGDSYLELPMLR